MGFWLAVFKFVLLFLITALLAPKIKTQDAKAANLGDFQFPRADEGAPVTLLWGRVRLRGPNTLWFGNLVAIPIKEKVKTGFFSSKQVTVAHEYSLTIDLAFALTYGSGVAFKRLWFGEKLAWTGNVTATGTTVTINEPDLFGGKKKGGGVVGDVTFYTGSITQAIDSHLTSVMPNSDLVTAYRGFAHLVFKDFIIGENPNMEPISLEMEIIPNVLGLGGVGSEGDANPAEVLFDIITDEWGRPGLATVLINNASFITGGNTLDTENHGISLKVESSNSVKDIMQEVLSQIDGIIFEDPENREIKLKLIRDDYVLANLEQFDEGDIDEITNFSKSNWNDTFNQTRVIFISRDNDYINKTAFAQDMANVNFQGGKVRSTNFNFPGVKNITLGNIIANRELQFLSIPLITASLIMNRRGLLLKPGDAFKLSWADYNIVDLVVRVQNFDLGELDDNKIIMNVIQDRFATASPIFSDPPDSLFVPPVTTPVAATLRAVNELPRYLVVQHIAGGEPLNNDPDETYLHHVAAAPNSITTSFNAEVSADAGANYDTDLIDGEFAVNAQLNAAVVKETVENIAGASPFVLKLVSDDSKIVTASISDVAGGKNMLRIGNELISYEGFTESPTDVFTLNDVNRGLLDTSKEDHSENAVVWFMDSVGFNNFGIGNYTGTGALKTRLITENGFGSLDPASAVVDDLTLEERVLCPYPPDVVLVDSVENISSVIIDTTTLTLDWFRRDRLKSTITIPDAADESPEGGTTYTAKWTVDGGSQSVQAMGNVVTYDLDFVEYGAIVLEMYAVLDSRESLYPVIIEFDLTQPDPRVVGSGSMIIGGASSPDIDIPYPSSLANEDLLLMCVFTRSALTVPSGWSLVDDQIVSNSGFDQELSILSKTSDGTETGTLNVEQASSARMSGQMINIRSAASGVPTVSLHNEGQYDQIAAEIVAGSLTGAVDDTLAIIAVTNTFAVNSPSLTDIDPPAGYNHINPTDEDGKRLAWAHRSIDSSFVDSGITWTTTPSGGDTAWMHLLVLNP